MTLARLAHLNEHDVTRTTVRLVGPQRRRVGPTIYDDELSWCPIGEASVVWASPSGDGVVPTGAFLDKVSAFDLGLISLMKERVAGAEIDRALARSA